jgi:pyrimidine operon attenuation protein/uracil phosphoribosyltransferase
MAGEPHLFAGFLEIISMGPGKGFRVAEELRGDRLPRQKEPIGACAVPLVSVDRERDRAAGDDLGTVGPVPLVGESNLPMEGVDDKTVVVVDDVLFTGRTARAAINELMDWGRPSRILLCVLVDRGGRELPIQPDIVGRKVSVLPRQTVEVCVPEVDGRLAVELSYQPSEGA